MNERKRLLRSMKHLLKLIDLDAPTFLKAQALIDLIVPSMMRTIGMEACANVLHANMLKALCVRCGVCTMCKKNMQDCVDFEDDLCSKCRAEADQFSAQFK